MEVNENQLKSYRQGKHIRNSHPWNQPIDQDDNIREVNDGLPVGESAGPTDAVTRGLSELDDVSRCELTADDW